MEVSSMGSSTVSSPTGNSSKKNRQKKIVKTCIKIFRQKNLGLEESMEASKAF